jgi:hypothetical protein
MELHQGVVSTPRSRAVLVRRVLNEGWTVGRVGEALGLSVRNACPTEVLSVRRGLRP